MMEVNVLAAHHQQHASGHVVTTFPRQLDPVLTVRHEVCNSTGLYRQVSNHFQ